MSNFSSSRLNTRFGFLTLIASLLMLSSTLVWAQTTLSTGSISGTVTDPSGAVVSDAKVVITNVNTGQTLNLTTNSAGTFGSGPLEPGHYKVEVTAKGFSTVVQTIAVQIGNAATFNT